MNPIALDRLQSQLLTTGLQQKDNPLFQVISQLIRYLRQSVDETAGAIDDITGGGGGGSLSQSIVTINNELGTLPNSRRIVAGNGISFNNDGQRLTIHSAVPMIIEGLDGPEGPMGPQGLQGIQGIQGLPGSSIVLPVLEPDDSVSEVMPWLGNIVLPEEALSMKRSMNGTQSLADSTQVTVAWDTLDFSSNAGFSMDADNNINLPWLGGYLITLCTVFQSGTVGDRLARINEGGTTAGTGTVRAGMRTPAVTGATALNLSLVMQVTTLPTTIRAEVLQVSGGALNLIGSAVPAAAGYSWISIVRLW